MWQPCVPQSPSQRSHWPRDCEKLQQAQDPHIHMEIWVYKYRAGAEEKAAHIQQALLTEQDRSDSTAMAPTVFGQASFPKEHLTPAHKVSLISTKSHCSLVELCLHHLRKCDYFYLTDFFLSLSCSWENQWLRNCAETASTPASSSWSPCWALSSSGSSPTPSRRRRTSWRWPWPIWEAGSSRSRPAWPPAWWRPAMATPGACRRPSASCPTARSRPRPTAGSSATSRVCRHPARPATVPPPSPLLALRSIRSAPARVWARPAVLCGGPGRVEAASLPRRERELCLWTSWTES